MMTATSRTPRVTPPTIVASFAPTPACSPRRLVASPRAGRGGAANMRAMKALAPVTELPTAGDIRNAIYALEAAQKRTDLPSRELLRLQQACLVNFWHTYCRYHAQREAIAILNEARAAVFRRPPIPVCHCKRLYAVRRCGTRRSDLAFYPSTVRLVDHLLRLPGGENRCTEIALATGATVRNVKARIARMLGKEKSRVAA